ncbi:MAG: serine/threonine-protein kinase, partial [Planctomycetota bacterium]|nr:serine/threonine-protein kinase [Planctomycetota bacterium]
MNRNEAQAHCILAWNLLTQATVNVGMREVLRRPEHDLCSLLVYYKRLTPSQADQVKRAVDRAIKNRQITLEPVSESSERETRPLNSAQLLEKIEKTNDLINTLRMSAPRESLNPPAVRNPGLSEPEDLASANDLQDGLSTLRVSRKKSDGAAKGMSQSGDDSGELLVDTTKESQRSVVNESGTYMGMKFTRFDILGEIASGAMGVILRAWHIPSKKVCALKVLFDDELDKTVFARFRREAKVLARLEHPNIVKIIEHGYENDDPFLAMEFIVGKNLKDQVKKELKARGAPPEPSWAINLLIPIAKAVQYCHERGAIHRDIKPTNILVESSGRPVLVDFGLVKKTTILNTSVNASLSNQGEILGTPAYMAPEQLDAKGSHGEIQEKVDVWGFAATLFFCLTGQTPYQEESAMATYLALLTKDPRRAKTVNPNIPSWLDQLCHSCLQREISKRPTMATIISRLENRL